MEGLRDRLKNILCVRLDNMGDALMCSPAIRAIKESSRAARVTFLVSPVGADVARLMPGVDQVLVFEAPWVKNASPQNNARLMSAMIRRLKGCDFDGAVIFTTYSQSPLPAALLCFQAGIPVRIGICRENPYQLLTFWQKEEEPERLVRHEVRRQLDLVKAFGCVAQEEHLSLEISEQARNRARGLMERFSCPWFILHAGATADSRRYPLESYAHVIREAGNRGWKAVLSGVRDEKSYIDELARMTADYSINLCGRLKLEEFCGLLSGASFLLSNNTGVVHLASATRTPVVVLYALTNPQHTPWLVPSRVLFEDASCKYCYKSVCPEGHNKCLRAVSPETIMEAIEDLLKETRVKMPSVSPL